MKIKLLFLFSVCSLLILQSCSKQKNLNPIATNPTTTAGDLKLDAVGDHGTFQLYQAAAAKSMEVKNKSLANGGLACIKAFSADSTQAKWVITDKGSGYYTIMNKLSGKYLQSYLYNSTQVMIQATGSGTDAQLWNISNAPNGFYKIVNKADGLAMTNIGGATADYSLIMLAAYANNNTQWFGFGPIADGIFTVASALNSNMVVQRDKPFQVWGTATAGTTIGVKASWNASLVTTNADASGNWILSIQSAPANANPQTLTINSNGGTPIVFTNILIGDVWIASGQSNMVMPLMRVDSTNVYGGFYGVKNYTSEIAAADHPHIRVMTTTGSVLQGIPLENLFGQPQWVVCSPSTAGKFSALSYYFAKIVDSTINVPIGVVVSAVSGSACEAWTSQQTIAANPLLNSYYKDRNFSYSLYNSMIYPLRHLSVKGFIWDQGEANESDTPASNYTVLNTAMIQNWRTIFNQGNLPFYFVEMIPFYSGYPADHFQYALFREAQSNVRNLTKTGMAGSSDINELFNIHYTTKAPVGKRLALLALQNDYGVNVNSVGPSYKSFTQSGSKISIQFNNANGLKSSGSLSQNFRVAGADHVFYNTTASISGSTIVLTLPSQVTTVASVRGAFTDYAVNNIYNSDNLPMTPFRTDNWTN